MRTQYKIVQQAFDDKPLLSVKQYKFLINPLTEQIPATSAELLRETTHWLIEVGDFDKANKIAGEEDKASSASFGHVSRVAPKPA